MICVTHCVCRFVYRGSGDIRASGNQATHMTRSARVEASDAGAEEEHKAEPAAAARAALEVVTGLEDPAISQGALAAAEASRRAHTNGQDDAHGLNRRSSISVFENDFTATLGTWLDKPIVAHEMRITARALSDVENGTGSIEDVNMYYAVLSVDFDLIDRFVKAGGQ